MRNPETLNPAGAKHPHKGGGGKSGGAVGAVSSGVASVSGGVGHATGTSTGYSSAGAGVASVASGVGKATGTRPTAPTPTYSPYQSRSTTTVNLKPLMSTITDPATRALASSAISNGLKYEVNPSLLIASASVTDYGRKGQGKGYTNLGDGSETGAKSIRQAAKYLSEVGFHDNPQQAITALAKRTGADPEQLRKTAAGYTALDEAARKIENAPGDTRVTGVGHFKYRKPEDRPSAKAMRAAAAGMATAGITASRAGGGYESPNARAAAEGQDVTVTPMDRTTRAAAQAAGEGLSRAGRAGRGPAVDPSLAGTIGRATVQASEQIASRAQAANGGKRPAPAQGNAFAEQGPNPRKVAKRLTRASKRATPEISGMTDPNQAEFAAELAKETGLSPRVVAAWVRQEGGNLNPGDNNWLNIGAFDSGFDQGIMGDPRFRDPVSAAKVTADFLRGKVYGASEGIQQILGAAGASDQQQIAAIANSGWASDPNYAANISRNYQDVSANVGKDVPKQLVQRGYDVLGREATKALLAGGKLVKAPKGGLKEKVRFDGRYAGSQDVVRFLVGTRVKGDHGGTKNGEAPGVHSATGDHYRADGYAQDINGTSPGENEPAYDQGTLDTIVANLRKAGAQPPPDDLQIGENWEGTVGKYSVQVLTNEDGTINHIHVGAHPTDGEGGGSATTKAPLIPIKGTHLAVKPPAAPAAGGATGAAGSAAAGAAGSPATGLAAATAAVEKARAGGGAAIGGVGTIQSAAAAYARKSLSGDDTGDPIYDAFRPRR